MRVWLVPLLMAFAVSSASAENIRVMAAGSLKDAFTAIFADYSKRYGGGFSPVWGPSGTLRERLQNGEAFDVFASAALPHAQTLTDTGISGPSVLFVRNALCIVTDAGRELNAGNLVETLLKPEIRIGTSTPVADPSGDYTWEVFRKIDARRPGAFDTLSKKAQQLVGGPAAPGTVNGRPRLLVALDDHEIDLFISYCSGAQTTRPGIVQIQIAGFAGGVYGGPRIRIDGVAQGRSGRGRFRDLSAFAAGAGEPEILRLHSRRSACRMRMAFGPAPRGPSAVRVPPGQRNRIRRRAPSAERPAFQGSSIVPRSNKRGEVRLR